MTEQSAPDRTTGPTLVPCPFCETKVVKDDSGDLPPHLNYRGRPCFVGAPVPTGAGCPFCGEKAGTLGMFAVTDLAISVFMDSEGRRHTHDPNYSGEHITCANGHDYRQGARSSCFCGWTW